jgi:hypothetical protein
VVRDVLSRERSAFTGVRLNVTQVNLVLIWNARPRCVTTVHVGTDILLECANQLQTCLLLSVQMTVGRNREIKGWKKLFHRKILKTTIWE